MTIYCYSGGGYSRLPDHVSGSSEARRGACEQNTRGACEQNSLENFD